MKKFTLEFTKVADFTLLWDCCDYVATMLCDGVSTGELYSKCSNEPTACFYNQGVVLDGKYAIYIIKGSKKKTSLWICLK